MSAKMDTIYDNHVAMEKLKMGTKYERLAAIVFKILNESDVVVHDLTLRGDGKKTGHQIDVTIQKAGAPFSKRVLVECKDYDTKVGISVIRDFHGALHQIKPDESFVVTTEGYTRSARTFAEEEGIKLAILREFKEEDWEGRIKKFVIEGRIQYQNPPKIISWVVANQKKLDEYIAQIDSNKMNTSLQTDATRTYFCDQNGTPIESMQKVLQPIFGKLPTRLNEIITGRHEFEDIKHVFLEGILVEIKGFDYEYTCDEVVIESIVEAEHIAKLIFQVIDGDLNKIIFDQDLDKWTFDQDGEVISK